MSNQKPFKNIAFWFACSLFWVAPAYSAVQLGNHMDLVLDNGTIVRVFPKAESSGNLARKPIPRYDPKVSSKPLGGDPCVRLEKEYKQRSAKKKSVFELLRESKPESRKPSWLKKTRGVKRFNFSERAASEAKPKDWYYLPTEPHLSYKENGQPEATFVKFITDEESGDNAAEGAIFHLMVTYGLEPAEVDELAGLLEDAVPNARLMGMVDLEPAKTGDNFIVTSGTLSDKGFAPEGVLTSGRAPTVPGSKAAIAGRLSSLGAQLMVKTFENPTADMSVTFTYDYIAKVPAFTGQVRIDLDKVRETAECSLKTHDKQRKSSGLFGGIPGYAHAIAGDPLGLRKSSRTVRISDKELEEAYDTLVTLGAIEIIIDQNLPDADVTVIEASLMDMALASFTSMQKTFMTNKEFKQAPANAGKKSSKNPDSNHWEVYKLKRKREKMSGTITLNITKNVAVYRTHAMTGNLGGLLRDHKDAVFSEVLLNDPFFKRGKITVDLDTEALELFENKLVNNASIKVIVPFQGQASYENNDIFTSKDVQGGKIVSQFSFATRGEDKINQSCPYKYIESWSLRGGGKWPKNPQAVCSSEMSVTLVPPVKLRRIEVEADLGEMDDAGFRAADVVLRHTRYGKRQKETAKLRVAKGEPYVEVDLVVDKDNDVVEYQLILTHKEKGQLKPSPWQKLDGDFVYASIGNMPLDYLKEINEIVPQIQQILPVEIQELLVSKAM